MKWAYGVTTVPERFKDLLPQTLISLAGAGFCHPRLFVDGLKDPRDLGDRWGLEVTCRWPKILTFGNWILGLAELYIREPSADRYAIFQDDLIACRNLRGYLDRSWRREKTYLNLYTFPHNQALCGKVPGWYPSDQMGKGAVGLAFDHEGVVAVLSQEHTLRKPRHAGNKNWQSVDGAVVTAMKHCGYQELVHNPSLLQHVSVGSTMRHSPYPQALAFPGEEYDATDLLKEQQPCMT